MDQIGKHQLGAMNRTAKSKTNLFSGLLTCGVCGGPSAQEIERGEEVYSVLLKLTFAVLLLLMLSSSRSPAIFPPIACRL